MRSMPNSRTGLCIAGVAFCTLTLPNTTYNASNSSIFWLLIVKKILKEWAPIAPIVSNCSHPRKSKASSTTSSFLEKAGSSLVLKGVSMFLKPNGVLVFVGLALVTLTACNGHDKPTPPPLHPPLPQTAPPTERVVGPLSPADAQALSTMNDRLGDYIDLHTKLERSLPKLPKDATPQQIDKNQRAFEALMRNARATAKPGDIFTPEARPVIKRLLATVFGGPEGRQLKASIMDENSVGITISVNGRYPDNGASVQRPARGAADTAEADRGHGVPVYRRPADPAGYARARRSRLHRRRTAKVERRGPQCLRCISFAPDFCCSPALFADRLPGHRDHWPRCCRRCAAVRRSRGCTAEQGGVAQIRRPRRLRHRRFLPVSARRPDGEAPRTVQVPNRGVGRRQPVWVRAPAGFPEEV